MEYWAQLRPVSAYQGFKKRFKERYDVTKY